MPGMQKGGKCIQQQSRCGRALENRKRELLHPYDNKQGQANETHWQRAVRKRKQKAREGEKEKNILPKRENIQPFENEEESHWKHMLGVEK